MVAVTSTPTAPIPVPETAAEPASRHIGVVPTASMIIGAAVATVWFWVPLAILVIAVSSIPSIIGFLLAAVVFVYLMRGVDRVERVRSEAVFGMQIPVPSRKISGYKGFQRWAHQLLLDVSSVRFWKSAAHHYLRMTYDLLAGGLALALLAFAFLGPAAALAVQRSDEDAGLRFLSPRRRSSWHSSRWPRRWRS